MVETDVTIRSGKYNLQATFTYPMNGTHFPTIVMVAGEGPCDMDVSKGPNKFFKDLACGFAMNGIASLRLNKRPSRYPEVNDAPLTGFTPNEEIIEDAIAAVRSAKSILAVDTTRVTGTWVGRTSAPAYCTDYKTQRHDADRCARPA